MKHLTPLCAVGLLGIVASLAGASCELESDEPASPEEAESPTYRFRDDIQITLRPGTALDEDERAARHSFGATLQVDGQVSWFASVASAEPDQIRALGLNELSVRSARVLAGPVAGAQGDDCAVLVEVRPDQYFGLTRPRGEEACPRLAPELEGWLPEAAARPRAAGDGLGVAQQQLAFGQVVGTFNGIDAFSNGTIGYVSNQTTCCGMKWQAVEYANRYFYQRLGFANLKGTGNPKDYFASAAQKGLLSYANGSATKPAVDDMIVSDGGVYGHIAVVREVWSDQIKVIQQNWANDASDNEKTLPMTYSNGKYTVAGFSGSYPVKGWLRKPPCAASVTGITPLSATLNKSTKFVVSGTCLPATIAPWIADCKNLVLSSVMASYVEFKCTPSAAGMKSGLIKDKSGGNTLKSFTVSVQ